MKTKILLPAVSVMLTLILSSANLSFSQGTWEKKAEFPGASRYNAASFSIGTKGYVGIGYNDADFPARDFWEWDQTTNVWTRKADYPGNSTGGVVCFSIGTKGYIGTGNNFSTNGYTNEFWEYDPATDNWTQKASLPVTIARLGAAGFSIGTKGYIGTGSKDPYTTDLSGTSENFQDFWEWDQATDVWTRKADFAGIARNGAVGFSIGNKGYIGTGLDDNDTPLKDFWEWDQAANVWTQKADFGGESRFGTVGFSIGNKGYLVTGMNPSTSLWTVFKDLWEWNQTTNSWIKKADFSGDIRSENVGFSIGNKGYIAIGYNFSTNLYYSDLWEFDTLDLLESLTDIIPVGSSLKKLSTDQFEFGEGPVWYGDSVLLFTSYRSSLNQSQINKYNPVNNKFSVFRSNIDINGQTLDKDGNLLICSWGILMLNQSGGIVKSLAQSYNGKSFNSLNDLIADNKGGVYFTDPVIFGSAIQDKNAVYYVDSNKNVKRVIDDLVKPNGVILSPDGKKLYVGDSDTKYVYSWEVASDGSLSGKAVFAELETIDGDAPGSDGMAVDIYGNIYIASHKNIQIFSPPGTFITHIAVPENALNCDFGGKDFKTLYITGFTNLYSIDLNYPGYAVSRKGLTSSMSSIPNKSLIEIYPNPVKDVLHIDLPGKTGMLEAYDITGKLVLQKQIHESNTSINVSGLKNGIYFVKVSSDKQIFTGKMMKY
jgi:sugar lactone lactonase YvrE/N-acetylneuraminic acid mutarotase